MMGRPSAKVKTGRKAVTTRNLRIKQAEVVSTLLDLCERNGSTPSAIRDALSRKHGVGKISMLSIRQALRRAVKNGDIQLNITDSRFKLAKLRSRSREDTRNERRKKGRGKGRKSRGQKKGKGKKGRRRRRRRSKKGKKQKKGRKGKGRGRGRRGRKKGKKGKKGKARKPRAKKPKAEGDAPPAPTEAVGNPPP